MQSKEDPPPFPPVSRFEGELCVFSKPTHASREMEGVLQLCAITEMEQPVPDSYNMDNVIKYVALRTSTLPRQFSYVESGHKLFLLTFPCRYLRDWFLSNHGRVRIDGCWVNFKAWRPTINSIEFKFQKKAWIKVYNMPEHYYCFEKLEEVVFGFGRLVEIDSEKAKFDLESLDALTDCVDIKQVTGTRNYFYAYCMVREITIVVELDIGFQWFVELGLDNPSLSYVEKYCIARDAKRGY